MLFRICSKNVMNVVFLSNKIKNIYLDSKNKNIVKILWYFIIFLNFFFNIIKLGKPKFTISLTKFILIFSREAADASISFQRKWPSGPLTQNTAVAVRSIVSQTPHTQTSLKNTTVLLEFRDTKSQRKLPMMGGREMGVSANKKL